jgi:hypothetical protein
MGKNYDIDHELAAAIDEALSALMNVPEVGKRYDQQHSDTQIKAYLRLKDAKANSDAF